MVRRDAFLSLNASWFEFSQHFAEAVLVCISTACNQLVRFLKQIVSLGMAPEKVSGLVN
jgi:hypothetical protein